MLDSIVTAVVQGTVVSSIYALIAIGFTMVFGVGGVLNLAHGALIMAGAYIYAIFTTALLFPGYQYSAVIGVILATVIVAVLSLALYEVLVRWVEDNPILTFLTTVITAVALTQLILFQYGDTSYRIVMVSGLVETEFVNVQYHSLIGFAVSWVLIGLLWYYVTRTDDGRSIVATSMSERGAELTGVNIHSVRAKTWLIAGAFAGVAGVFLGTSDGVTPLMWLNPLAIAFIVVVVGGIGSIKGSVIGAYLIGFLEQATVELMGSSFRSIPPLILLVAFMLFMPQGLFGREFHE
jgi:branched-chain amino acid transport system permease protein